MIKSLFKSIKDIKRIKLNYTKEMEEQDILWDKNKEDANKMEILQKELVEEAKKKGLKNYCIIDNLKNETITYIFNTEKEEQSDEWISSSNCKKTKEYLENLLNNETISWDY